MQNTSKQIKVQGAWGEVSCNLLGDVHIEGRRYVILDLGAGGYIKGIYSKYVIVSPSELDIDLNDKVEVIHDTEQSGDDERPGEPS